MRNVNQRNDGVGDKLTPGVFNSFYRELENVALLAGYTLDEESGTDTNLNMLAGSVAGNIVANSTYNDAGTSANTYILSPLNNFANVTNYFDGLVVFFKPSNTNTGSSVVNVNSLGIKSIRNPDNTELSPGALVTNRRVGLTFDFTNDFFVIIENSQFSDVNETVAGDDENRFVKPNGFGTMANSGSIELYATSNPASIPSEYLRCNGAAVSRSTYNNLFQAIGTRFGSGNGTTTFNVPNITDPNANIIYIIKI